VRRKGGALLSTLAEHLADYMETHEGGQEGVAVCIGTTQQTVSGWIRGTRPKESAWGALAELLGLSYEQVEAIIPSNSRQARRRSAAESLRSIGSADHGGKETTTAPDMQTREELLVENRRLRQQVTELEARAHDLEVEKRTLLEVIRAKEPRTDIDDYRSLS
jgi:hypothetical protein